VIAVASALIREVNGTREPKRNREAARSGGERLESSQNLDNAATDLDKI
jgi:hypothetical protein